jgi:hypothetical protein
MQPIPLKAGSTPLLLQPGDVFCVKGDGILSDIIRADERMWAKDDEAVYSHTGIILTPEGHTLEALSTIRTAFLDRYAGCQVLIGRWNGMNAEAFERGYNEVKGQIGQIYAGWRLPLFLIPLFAKFGTNRFGVCSELACRFWLGAGFKEIGAWKGQNPDDVADYIEHWRNIDGYLIEKLTYDSWYHPSMPHV